METCSRERDIFDGIFDEYLHQSLRKMSSGEEVSDEFFDCIEELDCKKLLSMIEKHPQWVVEVGPQGRTALHTAVIANSAELVWKLLCIAFKDGNRNPRASQLVNAEDKKLKLKAREIALITGNEKIVGMLTSAVCCLEKKHLRPFHLYKDSDGNMTQESVGNISGSSNPLSDSNGSKSFRSPADPTEIQEALSNSGSPNPNVVSLNSPESLHSACTSSKGEEALEVRLQQIREKLEPIMDTDVKSIGEATTLRHVIESSGLSGNEFSLHAAGSPLVFYRRRPKLLEEICGALTGPGSSGLLSTLLQEVRDQHGRTPLHVLVDSGDWSDVMLCIRELMSHCPNLDINSVKDFVGRTPLHWAAALGHQLLVKELAEIEGVDLNVQFHSNITALHLAVVHNHNEVVKILLMQPECDLNVVCFRDIVVNVPMADSSLKLWTPIQVAAMKGHVQILHELMKDDRLYECGMLNLLKSNESECHNGIPALHLAAASGNPLTVKVLLNHRKINAFALDDHGNTALHYAAAYDFQEFVHLGHFVSVHHYSQRLTIQKKSVGGIIGCMDLLMQAGLDMEQQNYHGATPELGPSSSDDLKRWWYEKMAKQTQEIKNNLVAAANAISVTAALVATASFVGPLQPPLGLSTSTEEWLTGYSQVNHTAVEVFLFCDNLSFYLAIASIMLAVIPSLEIPEEGLSLEVSIAGSSVQASVVLLFASITCVICAFSAASIAIVPETRWKYKGLIIVSTTVGTLVCFAALCLFSLRLLRLIKPKNKVIRRLNDVLSFWIAERRSRRASKKHHTRIGTSSSMYVKVKGALAKIIQLCTRDRSLESTRESEEGGSSEKNVDNEVDSAGSNLEGIITI